MPLADTPADYWHFIARGLGLEDQSLLPEDESEALETLFADYLLPRCNTFLHKEAHAVTPFWRTWRR